MKLSSWNVNGIRAAVKNGFLDWFEGAKSDVVALQEVKATPHQLEESILNLPGYSVHWFAAEKLGYSGVATYTKHQPLQVIKGIGEKIADAEGRVLTLEFENFYHINTYFPNSQREGVRLPFKLQFCKKMDGFVADLRKKKPVVICGDLNIAHQAIDLKNPKQNEKNAGFLPEERAWMTYFLGQKMHDPFRERTPEPGHYTWWSYRPGIRERNIGWRLDYHLVSSDLLGRVQSVGHEPQVRGSDHCPVFLTLK